MSDLNHDVDKESSPLSDEERQELHALKREVEDGQKTFVKVGNSLRTIRTGRLHRETHRTFEAYVEERFGIGRGHAYNLIAAADAAQNLATFAETAPINEYQVRPLVKLGAEQQKVAWGKAVAEAQGKRPTHDVVKAVVDEMTGKQSPVQFAVPSELSISDFDAEKCYWQGELSELVGEIDPASVDLLMVSALGSDGPQQAANEFQEYLVGAQRALKSDHQVLLVCPFSDYRAFVSVAEADGYEFGVPLSLSIGEGRNTVPFSFLCEAQFVLHFRKGDAALSTQISNVLSAAEENSIPGGKPLELIDELISAAIPTGSVVLDPSVGSAATVGACRQNGRTALGIQSDPDVYQAGLDWLKAGSL